MRFWEFIYDHSLATACLFLVFCLGVATVISAARSGGDSKEE